MVSYSVLFCGCFQGQSLPWFHSRGHWLCHIVLNIHLWSVTVPVIQVTDDVCTSCIQYAGRNHIHSVHSTDLYRTLHSYEDLCLRVCALFSDVYSWCMCVKAREQSWLLFLRHYLPFFWFLASEPQGPTSLASQVYTTCMPGFPHPN